MKYDEKSKTAHKHWKDGTLKKTLDRFPERKDEFTTLSGEPILRLYTPEELDKSWDLQRKTRLSRRISVYPWRSPDECIAAESGPTVSSVDLPLHAKQTSATKVLFERWPDRPQRRFRFFPRSTVMMTTRR